MWTKLRHGWQFSSIIVVSRPASQANHHHHAMTHVLVSVGMGSHSIKVTGCSSRLYHSNYNNIKNYDLLVGTLNVDSIGVLQLGGWTLVLPRTLNLLVQWPAFFPSDAPAQGPSLVSQRSSPVRSHSLATVVGSLGTGLKSQCIKCIRTWCLRRLLLPQ